MSISPDGQVSHYPANSGMGRAEIEAEISLLAKQQIKAVKDSSFGGWDDGEIDAYWKRRERLDELRAQLAALDTTR